MYKIDLSSKAKYEGGFKYNENFDIVFEDFMKKEFKLKKVAKNKIESALLAINLNMGNYLIKLTILEYYSILIFRKALRFGDSMRKELLDIYLIVIKEIPIPIISILTLENNPHFIDLNFLISIYTNFLKVFELNTNLLDEVFFKSKFLIDKIEVEIKNKKERRDFYYMANFYTSYFIYFQELARKYSKGEDEDLELFFHYFLQSNKMFDITEEYAKDLIINCVDVLDNMVNLESVFKFYGKTYEVKMDALTFIKITFDYLIVVYQKMEKLFINTWELVDINENGYLDFEEFEKYLFLILKDKSKDNRWKTREYFK